MLKALGLKLFSLLPRSIQEELDYESVEREALRVLAGSDIPLTGREIVDASKLNLSDTIHVYPHLEMMERRGLVKANRLYIKGRWQWAYKLTELGHDRQRATTP